MPQLSRFEILMIGPLPPPVGGQSILIESILESAVVDFYKITVLNTSHYQLNLIKRLLLAIKNAFLLIKILLINKSIKIVHMHSSAGISLLEKGVYILILSFFKCRILLHVHGGKFKKLWFSYNGIMRQLVRIILARCHGLIVLSDDWRFFYRNDICYAGNIYVLPNAVKIQDVHKSSENRQTVNLLYVGHLKAEKGLLDLQYVVKDLLQHNMDICLFLMGSGDTMENENKIRKAFSDFPSDKVKFLGNLIGLKKWSFFSLADIMVLPSHSEDFPLCILEGMAAGLPVVATRVGSVPSMITDGIDGKLVDPANVAALRSAIIELILSPNLRKLMGDSAKKKYYKHYSFCQYEEKLIRIYSSELFFYESV